jgi:Tfp pilus assembly protein PilO
MLVGFALAVAAVIGGWMLVIEPILEHTRSAAELVPAREQVLQQRRELIARHAAIIAETEATTKRFDKLAEGFLTSATPAVAASELQKIVKDMAAQAKTEIRSERILPPAERGELLEIPVEIAVSCEIRQLVDLLSRLDSAPKLLPVQDVKIRVVNLSQPKDLLVTLTVSGLVLPSAQGKAKT